MDTKEFHFGDLVLVRNHKQGLWEAANFSFKADSGRYHCIGGGMVFTSCIPCNNATMHLLGTTDDYVEPYEPKDGDFVYAKGADEHIIIFRKQDGDAILIYVDLWSKEELDYELLSKSFLTQLRPATEEERQLLLDALHKEGKDWDPEKKEIVEYQWIPQAGVNYHTICFEKQRGGFFPSPTWWSGTSSDEYNKKNGWIFRDKDSAQKKADELNNKLLKGE